MWLYICSAQVGTGKQKKCDLEKRMHETMAVASIHAQTHALATVLYYLKKMALYNEKPR